MGAWPSPGGHAELRTEAEWVGEVSGDVGTPPPASPVTERIAHSPSSSLI